MDGNAATARLVTRMDAFLKYVRRHVGDSEMALDVLHDSFIKAYAKVGELRDEGALVPWFYRILRSTAADAHRRRSAETRALHQMAVEPTLDDAPPEDPAVRAMVSACLENLLPEMTPAYAELIRDLELGNSEADDFAQAHGLTQGALKVKRHRARRQLQHLIETVCQCLVNPAADCVCGCA